MMLTYFIYLGTGVACLLVGFLLGFFTGNYKSGSLESEQMGKELGFLTKETGKARSAADDLLKQAKLRRRTEGESHLPKVAIDETAGKPHPFLVEVRNIRSEIRVISTYIEAVILAKSPPSKETKKQLGDMAKGTGEPSGSQPPVDPLAEVLFDFDRSDDAPGQSYDGPEVIRKREPVEGEDLGLPPPEIQSGDMMSVRDVVVLYNLAVTDTAARERFREQVEPFRIGTINAVERRQNPTIDAEFRQTTDGDLFAFATSQNNQYAVVPRLGLTIEAVSYSAGALGKVFSKTRDHDPQRFYSHYQVLWPATFKCEGDRWQLVQPGELDLGPGD